MYFSSAWQAIEERNSSNVAQVQYTWSAAYIDAMIARDRDTDNNGTLEQRVYVMQDANWNITAIANSTGAVVERFQYDAYGKRTVLSATFVAASDTFVFNHGFAGGKADTVTGRVNFRNREYDVDLMRWTTMDPIGFAAGDMNWYQYGSNSPTNRLDPSGLEDFWWWWYNNKGGKALDVSNIGDLSSRINSAAGGTEQRLLDKAMNEAVRIAKGKGPNSSGTELLNPSSESHHFAGNKPSKIVGVVMEVMGGNVTDSNNPTIDRTSLFALGNSTINSNGSFSWINGPVSTHPEVLQVSVTPVYGGPVTGFWLTVTVTLNFSISDEFVAPYQVLNGRFGKGIETGMPYNISGNIGSKSATKTVWVELGRNNQKGSAGCEE